ncbi:Hypothetical protein NTJ_01933 [Nesidiocoris tenuis]|uniref:Uncharacterized protein n=1 Tax=Nesidiocoris tenuis TaxID=355587 RepID=A0ABN7A9Y9_9HEMI|nr:Hypothetical protein NTJ_01933 [Nesidiocoris tenuis]
MYQRIGRLSCGRSFDIIPRIGRTHSDLSEYPDKKTARTLRCYLDRERIYFAFYRRIYFAGSDKNWKKFFGIASATCKKRRKFRVASLIHFDRRKTRINFGDGFFGELS